MMLSPGLCLKCNICTLAKFRQNSFPLITLWSLFKLAHKFVLLKWAFLHNFLKCLKFLPNSLRACLILSKVTETQRGSVLTVKALWFPLHLLVLNAQATRSACSSWLKGGFSHFLSSFAHYCSGTASQVTREGHHQHANTSCSEVGFEFSTNCIQFCVFANLARHPSTFLIGKVRLVARQWLKESNYATASIFHITSNKAVSLYNVVNEGWYKLTAVLNFCIWIGT